MTTGLKSIAERAGVSVSTVSRFVSGKRIRPHLMAAVEAALAEGDYTPNLAARRLKARTNPTVGLVVPDLANPFFLSLAEAIENLAWASGHRLILCNSNEDPAREERYIHLLREEGVTGLLIAPAEVPRRVLPKVEAMPVVFLDRAPQSLSVDAVTLDNASASRALVRSLLAAGHRRIVGLFTQTPVVGVERRQGFIREIRATGLEEHVLPLRHGRFAQREVVREALGRWPDLDAVVAGNSPGMFAAATVLKERGHPATLAGFDRSDWLPLLDRPAFWIEQPVEEIAHAALSLLLDRERSPSKIVFQGVVRKS